jgi:hypothetical protein
MAGGEPVEGASAAGELTEGEIGGVVRWSLWLYSNLA